MLDSRQPQNLTDSIANRWMIPNYLYNFPADATHDGNNVPGVNGGEQDRAKSPPARISL